MYVTTIMNVPRAARVKRTVASLGRRWSSWSLLVYLSDLGDLGETCGARLGAS